jgi:hypothetical protein
MPKGQWPIPTIMNAADFREELEALASKTKNCDALIEIILALAEYHRICYEAQQELSNRINEILNPQSSSS